MSERLINQIVQFLSIHVSMQVIFENSHGPLQPLAFLVSAVRCHEEVWSMPEPTILRQRLNLEHIKDSPSYLSCHEGSRQIILIASGSSSNIHENSSLLHLVEAILSIEEIIGGDHLWQSSNDIVGLSDHLVVLIKPNDRISPLSLFFGDHLWELIDANDFHAESALAHLCDLGADVSVAHHNKGLA